MEVPEKKNDGIETGIPLFWVREIDNFGDKLAPVVVEKLFGKPFHYAAKSPRLLALGSVLNQAKDGDVVWGSGFWFRKIITTKPKVFAVRGPSSRELLLECGVKCPAVYGDPALLFPKFHLPRQREKHPLLVMPHRSDRLLGEEAATLELPAIFIDDDIWNIIDGIASCGMLVTSSLHGLIIAEAYEIPVVLLRNHAHCRERPHFKYVDYFRSTARQDETRFGLSIPEAAERPLSKPKFPDLDRLFDAFGAAADEVMKSIC